MNSFYLEQFKEKFCELIMDLSKKYEDKKYEDKIEIEVYKRSLDKLDYTKIAVHFATKLQPYSKLVSATDDALFNIDNLEFIDQINFKNIWEDNLSECDKKSLWQYIQILYLLSNIIIDPSPVSCDNSTNELSGDNSHTTINKMIETMKNNIENTNVEELSLDNISKKQIDEATNEVKSKFGSKGSNNVMEDMISEINKELTNMIDKKDSVDDISPAELSESNPQLDMMSQMLNIDKNGLGGIMNIANRVSQKFQSRVENGELDPAQLMTSAQSMLMGMQNIK